MTITRLYALWCDTCKTPGPEGPTQAEVVKRAKKLDWQITPPTKRHPHTLRTLCAGCATGTSLPRLLEASTR